MPHSMDLAGNIFDYLRKHNLYEDIEILSYEFLVNLRIKRNEGALLAAITLDHLDLNFS